MSGGGNGQQVPFEVRFSGKTNQTIKQLHQKALHQGRGKEFLAALRVIHNHLRSDPKTFGEPVFRLPALKLLIYQAVVLPIAVAYGVHQEKPLVIIQHVKFFE